MVMKAFQPFYALGNKVVQMLASLVEVQKAMYSTENPEIKQHPINCNAVISELAEEITHLNASYGTTQVGMNTDIAPCHNGKNTKQLHWSISDRSGVFGG